MLIFLNALTFSKDLMIDFIIPAGIIHVILSHLSKLISVLLQQFLNSFFLGPGPAATCYHNNQQKPALWSFWDSVTLLLS